mmetsp:Transcript_11154/g.27755  ORF Transcript_11154/g.27755 Transcript_11154/m.27755 type:complete len:100 (+) Transcript_11154:205-504(+)
MHLRSHQSQERLCKRHCTGCPHHKFQDQMSDYRPLPRVVSPGRPDSTWPTMTKHAKGVAASCGSAYRSSWQASSTCVGGRNDVELAASRFNPLTVCTQT